MLGRTLRCVRSRPRRGLLALLLVIAGCAAAQLGAAPARAHPFGPPPTATVSAAGDRVVVEWRAEPDDTIAVGVALGLLPPDALEAFREGPAQVAPPAAAEEALARSEALRAYLLDRIRVSQDGQACEAVVAPMADFIGQGARVEFTCPQPVTVVELTIAMLHDIHGAYRTFATAEGLADPPQAVFTVDTPRRHWAFGQAAQTAGLAWLPPLLTAAALLAGLVVLALSRRLRRSAS